MLKKWLSLGRGQQGPVSDAQWRRIEQSLPFVDALPADDRTRLRQLALRFLGEKEMYGAHGMELDNDTRLSIALQACLPILNLGLEYYDGWVGIVVYPGDFVVPRHVTDEDGVVHEYDDAIAGEAWDGGPVLLSWFHRAGDAGGMNVVIHEFAHKVDMLDGPAGGMPPLHAGMSRREWARVWKAAYEDFCRRADADEDVGLDPYAAEQPSEFFAVASEVFFQDPAVLNAAYPEVYRQLKAFYRQDPLERMRG